MAEEENLEAPLPPNDGRISPLADAVFKTCADSGRKRSLRSLEIPLENLLSGIVFLSGGRDRRGGAVLSLTQPEDHQVEMLMEVTTEDLCDMLAYFTAVPREEVRSKGFAVIVDADVIHDFLLRTMIKALNTCHHEEDKLFHTVYFISSSRDCSAIMLWNKENGEEIDLPVRPSFVPVIKRFRQLRDYSELEEFIAKEDLTPEFGGTLEYNHREWVRFRMQVEPFICDCISVSKHLANAIEPFTQEDVPETIPEAEESLNIHKLTRQKTLDSLHIEDLTMEGEKINERMKQSVCQTVQANPDFESTLATIQKLLSQIDMVKGRLETLWETRHSKLEVNLKQRVFEKEAKQVIEWFEEYAEEFFQTHTELGESLEVAEALVSEVQQFEMSTRQIIDRTSQLMESGSDLESHPNANQEVVQGFMGKIRKLMTDFNVRLGKRKTILDESVQLHRLTEAALDWCIVSADLLSEHDLLAANPAGLDAEHIKQEFDQFLTEYPPPSQNDLQQLTELTESIESVWIKENAVFAYNRVLEIKERFQYYYKILEEQIAEKKEEERKAEEKRKELMVKESRKVVEAVDSLLTKVSGDGEGESDNVFPETQEVIVGMGHTTPDPVELPDGDSKPEPVKTDSQGSLRYDAGIDEALRLLESTAQSMLSQQATTPSTGDIESTDYGGTRLTPQPLEEQNKEEPHRLSKQDISSPTGTVGTLFTENGEEQMATEEEPDMDIDRRFSCPEPEEGLAEQTKHARHRRKLMEELISTEENYIRHMQLVVEHYMPTMDNIAELPKNLTGRKNIVFANIQQLLEFNRQIILPQLHASRKSPIKLGQIFLGYEEEFLNYSMYFKNMPQQTKLMEEGGIEFFAAVQRRLGDSFTLGSYLIKPFQRITKYRLFLEDMMKHSMKAEHSMKSDQKGKMKNYYDSLKEAHKMVDFVLRHGNDLLAVESLRGFEGSIKEQGKILRQGDLVLVEHGKHQRRVFLFEDTIIFAKKKKLRHHHDVPGSEMFEFRSAYKTSDFGLRESISGHPTRFELWKKNRVSIVLQADTEEVKNMWVQDIWDLYFSHMLQLKELNLEAHGSRPLTSLTSSGMAALTRGRAFGHSLRTSIRYSTGRISRTSRELRSRPPSQSSNFSGSSRTSMDDPLASLRPGRHTYTPSSSSPRLSGTFVDLRPHRYSAVSTDTEASGISSNRSSIISTTSTSTVTSLNASSNNSNLDLKPSQLVSDTRKTAEEGGITGKITPIAENPEDSPTPPMSPEPDPEATIFDTPV